MKIEKILQIANLKCEENLSARVLLIYLNQGITRINLDCNLNLPAILDNQVVLDLEFSEDDFVNRILGDILAAYIAYCIRQNEGYELKDNTFFSEFAAMKMEFNTKFKQLIKQEYQLNDFQNGSTRKQTPIKIIKNKVRLW